MLFKGKMGSLSGSDDPSKRYPIVEIIKPNTKEMEDGLERLQPCIAFWKETPAFLLVKPDLGWTVSVLDVSHDARGFRLSLAAGEKLMSPTDYNPDPIVLACGWNQPYLSFDRDVISAPYCFTLYFSAEGVARVIEYAKSVPLGERDAEGRLAVYALRDCFRPKRT